MLSQSIQLENKILTAKRQSNESEVSILANQITSSLEIDKFV